MIPYLALFNLKYNISAELTCLVLAITLLFFMIYTRPRKTYLYKFVFRGTIASILAMVDGICIYVVASYPWKLYHRPLFTMHLISFLVLYFYILYSLFSYINLLSISRRRQKSGFMIMYLILFCIYMIGVIVELASGKMFVLTMNGIDLQHFTTYYCCAGLVCAVICLGASISNRDQLSKLCWRNIWLFVPLDVVLLLVQIVNTQLIMSSYTYVLAFTIYYMFFHSNPYDELTGCHNENALMARFRDTMRKSDFYYIYVGMHVGDSDNYVFDGNDFSEYTREACRSIERIDDKITLYNTGTGEYVNVIETSDAGRAHEDAEKIRAVMDHFRVQTGNRLGYIMIMSGLRDEFSNFDILRGLTLDIRKRLLSGDSGRFYEITYEDIDDYVEKYEISELLKDIDGGRDLDDERVLCYAQPIYNVEKNCFTTAEALMRLQMNGKIISPDRFIPIAESCGYIHTLTRIMLNKVCRCAQELSRNYDFDAITINCSSKELSNTNLYQDLLEIIDTYSIDRSKIRLELTETAMFDNYDTVSHNMDMLQKAGIEFYLDDFGTGYSSLERAMNCPFNTIKFDRSLLYRSIENDKMNDIISYMVDVLKKNGYITLIEGVEDERQNQYSVEHGFDFIQGYKYAKPEPINQLVNYFRHKG